MSVYTLQLRAEFFCAEVFESDPNRLRIIDVRFDKVGGLRRLLLDLRGNVYITRASGDQSKYWVMDRNTWKIRYNQLYPDDMLSAVELKSARVLDLGSGFGAFVEELRAKGVEAYGVDVIPNPLSKNKDYHLQRDMRRTGFKDKFFDVIFSTHSLSGYDLNSIEGEADYQFRRRLLVSEIFSEIHRILKPGGVVRISPFNSSQEFKDISAGVEFVINGNPVLKIPGFRVSRLPDETRKQQVIGFDSLSGEEMRAANFVELQRL